MATSTNSRPPVPPPTAPLAAIRKAVNLKQDEVCERVREITGQSFTVGALSAIEKGHRGASATTLAALEKALNLPERSLGTAQPPSHDRRPRKARKTVELPEAEAS